MSEQQPMDTERIAVIAASMIARYRSADKASAAATDHAMDYERETFGRRYWEAVREAIRRQAAGVPS